jgi:hypothetical protein
MRKLIFNCPSILNNPSKKLPLCIYEKVDYQVIEITIEITIGLCWFNVAALNKQNKANTMKTLKVTEDYWHNNHPGKRIEDLSSCMEAVQLITFYQHKTVPIPSVSCCKHP